MFADGGFKQLLIDNYAKLMKPLVEGEAPLTHRDNRTNDLSFLIWRPINRGAYNLYKTV